MIINLDGMKIENVVETANEITVILCADEQSFPTGSLVSNFSAFTGFTENADGSVSPIFSPITLAFNRGS